MVETTQLNLEFMKKKRKEQGITITEMARVLNLKSPSNYYKYETGEYALKADMLPSIAKALHCDVQDFFCKHNFYFGNNKKENANEY